MKPGWMVRGSVLAGAAMALAGVASAELSGPVPLAWRWAPQNQGAALGAPVVTSTAVYVGIGKRIYAIDRDSGNTLWRYPVSETLPSVVSSPVTLVGKHIVAGLDDGTVVAMDALTGKHAWRTTVEGRMSGDALAVDGKILYRTGGGEVMALNGQDGSPYWSNGYKPEEVATGGFFASEGAVIFLAGRTLTCLDVATQKPRWRQKFAQYDAQFNLVGDRIYASTTTTVTVLSALSGKKVWERAAPDSFGSPLGASTEYVVGVSRTGTLFAFDASGRSLFKNGIDIGFSSRFAPVVVGRSAIVATQVGAITMVDLSSGVIKWNTVVRAAIKDSDNAAGGLNSRGGQPVGNQVQIPKYVPAAAAPVLSGESLFVQARDGTVLSFDKANGVDLTPPEVKMLWPNAGDTVAGKSPMSIVFRVDDLGIGVCPDTVRLEINGKQYTHEFTTEGYLTAKITVDKKNPPLPDGRAKLVVTAIDWLGNKVEKSFSLTIDNLLPALGGPRARATRTTAGQPLSAPPGPGGQGSPGDGMGDGN